MAGTLFVVATPIGNLEDMTYRAVRVLREVALVAAEDTRRTGQLLRHFGIATKLVSLHRHNERERVGRIVARLLAGESVALVSDAGTPGVSDPGSNLVSEAVAASVRVEPVPGSSAVTAALSVSGVEASSFVFLGFPPARGKDRSCWFTRLPALSADYPVVFFEAPHRVMASLGELDNLSYNRIVVFRELTKLHESVYRGSPADVAAQIGEPVGEFVVVIPRVVSTPTSAESLDEDLIVSMFGQITDVGGREAARRVAAQVGISPNMVYQIVSRRKG